MGRIEVTIIQEISTDRFILKCACCGGTGKMSRDHDGRSPYEICSVCGGKGAVMVELDGQLPFVICQCCQGSGEMSRDLDGRSPYVVCEACDGVGAQPITGTMRLMR